MPTVRPLDTRNLPAYTYGDAEKYLHIPCGTLRSWVKGRTYETKQGKRFSAPLIQLPNAEAQALVREDFLRTDGQAIYVEHLERLLDASRRGQIAIRETLEIYLTRIEVDEQGIAARLFPFVHPDGDKNDPKVIVIDPNISFGRPVLVGTRIPTKVLADRYKSGESIKFLAEDYSCDRNLIQTALEYEGLAA